MPNSALDEVRRLEAEARREDAVARGGGAAALDVPEHGHARLVPGPALDLLAEPLADAALREQPVPELVDLALVLGARQLAALADDDDREVLAARVPPLDLVAHLVEVDRPLRDQDHVGAAGDAAVHGDPAGVAAHHLDDHDAVVRLGGRVQPVDRLGADRDRGVEAERVVGAREVVVDRLRDPDHRCIEVRVEPGSDAERVLAADRDERIELLERSADRLDAAVELVRVRARRADDRAAAREDPGDLRAPSGSKSCSTIPRQPSRTPTTSWPRAHERRATARITAFRPGQSPPPVRTPILTDLSRVYATLSDSASS